MPTDPHELRLQLVLEPKARTPEAKDAVKQELRRLGIEISGEGAATLSGRVARADFARLFDQPALETPGTDADDAELPIPDALRGRVTAITVAPPHLYLE